MGRQSKKLKALKKALAERKNPVDVFLRGTLVMSLWWDKQGKPQARVFDALNESDYLPLAGCLKTMAEAVGASLEKEPKKIIQLPNGEPGTIVKPRP